MKVTDAVFFTDNKCVRLETSEGKFYLTEELEVYDMHPSNHMAKKIEPAKVKELFVAIKKDKFTDNKEVRKWL